LGSFASKSNTIVAIIALAMFAGCASETRGETTCEKDIGQFISMIGTEKNEDMRVDLAIKLADYVQKNPSCGQNERIVDEIAVLLDDRTDGVRMGAAMALGYVGPSAGKSVPLLEKAIRRSDEMMDAYPSTLLPPTSSGSAAREAIREITGKRVPDYQEH
jgi:hypothetical protein